MNMNLLIAVLEAKGIISHDEAMRLVENLNNAPQATFYTDALATVKRLTDKPVHE